MNSVFNILVIVFFALLFFETLSHNAFVEDQCDKLWPRCDNIQNIVCEMGLTCQPVNDSCMALKVDNKFRKWVLTEHNRLRNKIASGYDTRAGAGPASNMMVMSYDLDLEYVATCNVNRCLFGHERCGATLKYSNTGQNLFWAKGKKGFELMEKSIRRWYEEIKNMDAFQFDHYEGPDDPLIAIGHFTQMVWATTTHVGCAKASYPNKKEFFLGCNYGPKGNVLKHEVYKRGKPCSECPIGVNCNRHYPALCGTVEPLDTNTEYRGILNRAQIFGSKYLTLGICYLLCFCNVFV